MELHCCSVWRNESDCCAGSESSDKESMDVSFGKSTPVYVSMDSPLRNAIPILQSERMVRPSSVREPPIVSRLSDDTVTNCVMFSKTMFSVISSMPFIETLPEMLVANAILPVNVEQAAARLEAAAAFVTVVVLALH